MEFISHGDFIFPFKPELYWIEHLFTWSYQNGAANLDGIIRLPGRLLNLAVFSVFGNLAASFFYILLCLAIAFLSFYFFGSTYLKIKNKTLLTLASLAFMLNPIFLGNFSKIGLVAAAAMLPLAIALIHQGFDKRKFFYFVLYIFTLNFSLLHPFTFVVNIVISGSYFLLELRKNNSFFKKNLASFFILILAGFLMNLYFILPTLSIGSIEKSVLSENIFQANIDNEQIVNIANAGDILTALSLSKNVLKDYEFYTSGFSPIYFIIFFSLYVFLIGTYFYIRKRISKENRKKLFIFLIIFSLLILFSTAKLLFIDEVIKFLIGLPGGWIFRSPLKWQLYIPVFLFGIFLLVSSKIKKRRAILFSYGFLVILALVPNLILYLEIGNKLLLPRKVSYFTSLDKMNLDSQNLLYVEGDGCAKFSETNPDISTELNQILLSKNVQVKRIASARIGEINPQNFDYAATCALEPALTKRYLNNFKEFEYKDELILLKNQTQAPIVEVFDSLYSLKDAQNITDKRNFVVTNLEDNFRFTDPQFSQEKTLSLENIFERLTISQIADHHLVYKTIPEETGFYRIFVQNLIDPLYYQISDNNLTFSKEHFDESNQLAVQNGVGFIELYLNKNEPVNISYFDSEFNYANLFPNPNFSNGLWQEKVGDCFAYDDNPQISMRLKRETNASSFMELAALRHIACTGPDKIPVEPNSVYILNFDYRSNNKNQAGYFVEFTSQDGEVLKTIRERFPEFGESWHNNNKIITTPEGAVDATITVYAYPNGSANKESLVHYDNFYFTKIPDILDSFYLVENKTLVSGKPILVDFETVSPTRKRIKIKNAASSFFISFKDTFHQKWGIFIDGERISAQLPWSRLNDLGNHFILNNFMNGWYIDPTSLCANSPQNCKKNDDGTYDLILSIEFIPQKWFFLGSIVSSIVFLLSIGYIYNSWHKK